MLKSLILQMIFMAAVAAIVALWFGAHSAWSVVFGCVSVLVPHLLFVRFLKRATALMDRRMAMAVLLLGEFTKVVATLGIVFVAYWMYRVDWLWLVLGLVLANKVNLIALMLKK